MRYGTLMLLVLPLVALFPVIADGAGSGRSRGHLQVNIAPAHPVFGHPLRLTVRAAGAARPLAELSLAPLHKVFSVQEVVSGHDHLRRNGHNVVVETLTVTLYPLRAGRITLPSLHLGSWSSRARQLRVAATGAPGAVIRVRRGVDRHRLWAREETLVHIDVYDDGGGVLAELPAWHPAGAFVRRLDTRTRRVKVHGVMYNVTRLSWAVMPLHGGPLRLDFPLLHVRARARFGKRLLYPVATLHLQARALPDYIPPRVPVGAVHLRSMTPTGHLWPDRPYTWRLLISGTGLDLDALRSLLGPQLRRAPGLRFYQPLYERIADGDGGTLSQTFRVSVPFVARDSGELRLPALSLPFVNVKTGLLATASSGQSTLEVSSPFWFGLGWTLAVASGLIVLGALGTWLRAGLRRHAARRAVLHGVAVACGPRDIAAALLAWRGYGTWAPRTLSQWRRQVLRRRNCSGMDTLSRDVADAIGRLERACYGPHAYRGLGELPGLREQVDGIIRRL